MGMVITIIRITNKMKIEERLIIFLSAISIFILSLEDFSDVRYLYLAPLIFFCFTICLYTKHRRSFLVIVFSFTSYMFIYSLLGKIGVFTFKENMATYGSFDFLESMIFKTIYVLIILSTIIYDKRIFRKSIRIVLMVHVSIFIFQTIVVYSTGYYFDILNFFNGVESRYTWGVTIPIIGTTYRPTGLYVEPSTYFAMTFPLLVLSYIVDNNLTRVDRYTILSYFLTLSFASIIIVIMFLFLIKINKKLTLKYSWLLAFLLISITPLFMYLYNLRTSGGYDAVGIRANLITAIMGQDCSTLILGNGPAGVPSSLAYIYKLKNDSWVDQGFAPINDSGLLFFIIAKFGFLGLSIVVFHIFKYGRFIKNSLVLSLVLLTKIKLTAPVFIFFILSSLYLERKSNINCNERK